MQINITLPDGKVVKTAKGSSPFDIAKSISEGLARKVLSASINNELWDIQRPIMHDCNLKLHTFSDVEGKKCFYLI